MKSFAVVVLLLSAALLTACAPVVATGITTGGGPGPSVTGSRNLVERDFDISDFNSVQVSNGASVEIRNAGTASVKVTADDNVMDYVKVEKDGDTLVIGMKDGTYRNITLRAVVAMPELAGVMASGGSKVNFAEFSTPKAVTFVASGGAGITGKMKSGPAAVTASGGADITVDGEGDSLALNHSGGGNVKLGNFAVTDANVIVTCGSQSEINASGKVSGSVSGGGQLKLVGEPASLEVKESGGGKIVK